MVIDVRRGRGRRSDQWPARENRAAGEKKGAVASVFNLLDLSTPSLLGLSVGESRRLVQHSHTSGSALGGPATYIIRTSHVSGRDKRTSNNGGHLLREVEATRGSVKGLKGCGRILGGREGRGVLCGGKLARVWE